MGWWMPKEGHDSEWKELQNYLIHQSNHYCVVVTYAGL
jgi:hypothetical protein